MWKKQGSWNSFHAKLIPNSSIQYIGCRKQIRFCPCPNPRGEFQTLPNIISFRIIPHLKSVITCVRYIIQGRNRNSKKQSIIEMTIL